MLPTILIYHLGIDINKGLNAGDKARMEANPDWADNYEGNVHLGLDAAKLWVAIARGRAMTENVYSGHWDFWAHAAEPLEDLRRRWSVPPLDPAMAALDDARHPSGGLRAAGPSCTGPRLRPGGRRPRALTSLSGQSEGLRRTTALPGRCPRCRAQAVQGGGRWPGRVAEQRDAQKRRRGRGHDHGKDRPRWTACAVDQLHGCTTAQLEEVAPWPSESRWGRARSSPAKDGSAGISS